ncbi:MAG: Hsp20/alpha crystallin family protein [Polyangiaceae bacterium]
MTNMTTSPSVDVFESDGALYVLADMPGVHEDDVSVMLVPGLLRITGRADALRDSHGQCARYVRELPIDPRLEPDSIDATLHNGQLRLRIPKTSRPTPIPIEPT